jgi:hypothetical protein
LPERPCAGGQAAVLNDPIDRSRIFDGRRERAQAGRDGKDHQ